MENEERMELEEDIAKKLKNEVLLLLVLLLNKNISKLKARPIKEFTLALTILFRKYLHKINIKVSKNMWDKHQLILDSELEDIREANDLIAEQWTLGVPGVIASYVMSQYLLGQESEIIKKNGLIFASKKIDMMVSTFITQVAVSVLKSVNLDHREMVWDATLDSKTCKTCRKKHGTIIDIEKDELPPEHPFCRCRLIPGG